MINHRLFLKNGGGVMLNVPLFDINQITNIYKLYAHTKNMGSEKEFLTDHLNKTLHYFHLLYKEKNLDGIFEKLGSRFFQDEEETILIWKELLVNAIYLHDIGKINGNFQKVKMKHMDAFHVKDSTDSSHSMLSAVIYYNYYFSKVKQTSNKEYRNLLAIFLIVNSYIISKHHGNFDTIEQFLKKFIEAFDKYKNIAFFEGYKIEFQPLSNQFLKVMTTQLKEQDIDMYIYSRLVYSCLCAADFYATGDFMRNQPLQELGTIKNIEKYKMLYEQSPVYQSIQTYKKQTYPHPDLDHVNDINILRTELFLEAERHLQEHKEQYIFYVEAPTGGGKTNISINLSLQLLETHKDINKILYVFPFNTLVEQTYKTLLTHFPLHDDIAVLNSVTPMLERAIENEEEELSTDFEQTLLDRQFLHYPIVLTSHVRLFSYLFGIQKESIFALVHLVNSVIVLDEIQSYRNLIWKEIIEFLNHYAEILNIKVIIMSATMPQLGQLIQLELPSLITNKQRYFQHPLFKNRVHFDFTLLEQQDFSLEDLLTKVVEVIEQRGGKILIELIKKKSAIEFYKKLVELLPMYEVELLTGDDHKGERERIIKKALNESQLILVATQVVEAGVDIDMDIGFKNVSILDAEEQFAGRINRSCKKAQGGYVYFFELDKVNVIYKGDLRVNRLVDYSVRNPKFRKMLVEKDFLSFYASVFSRVEDVTTKQNEQNWENFRVEKVSTLNFIEIEKRMELITKKDYEIAIFINRDVELSNGEVLEGKVIWDQYKQLIYDTTLPFAERKVKLAQLNEKMSYFIYRVTTAVDYEERIGDIFYLAEGEQYFTDGKFDRESLQSQQMFL